jgi:hypothetical protein
MAVFVPGMPCALCGKPMTLAGEVIMFSPFVADRTDPLFVFSDAAMHAACFARHPWSEQATKWHEEAVRHSKPSDRLCAACGEAILDPDDYFGTGLLSRDAASALYEFNFVHLHQGHAGSWKRFAELRRQIESVLASGAWRGPRLVFEARPSQKVRWVVDS